MKLQGCLFFFFSFLLQNVYCQNSDIDIVRLAIKKTEQTKVFSYKFKVYFKSIGVVEMPKPWEGEAFVAPDSFICKYTSWGGRKSNYYSIRIGDSSVRYFIKPDIKQYDWAKTSNEQFAPYSGFNCYSNLAQVEKPIYYIKEAKFVAQTDTLLNGMKCSIIACRENTGNVENWTESRFYINKVDSFLVGFETFDGFGAADTIYRGYFFNDIKVNKRFDVRELENKLTTFKDITFDTLLNPPMVPAKVEGDKIKSFVVRDLFNNNMQIVQTKGKVVLLDFWYMACYGCILSYPAINRLHDEFAGNKSVEIYSVNVFDLEKNKQTKLREYVKKYDIKSSLVKMNYKELNSFKTNAYPTFYVIIDGFVKVIRTGANDELYTELKTLIDEGLKQLK